MITSSKHESLKKIIVTINNIFHFQTSYSYIYDENLQDNECTYENQIISDPVNSEFLYYCALLKEFAPQLTGDKDRRKIILWIKKLFRPEYQR